MDRKPSADKSINLQATNSVIDGDVSKALTERQQALRRGIGRRFVVRSPLPVHSSIMGGPFETDNVVGTLQGGQIVTSVDRIGKFWIKHDAGGWSYVKQNGVISVEFIKE